MNIFSNSGQPGGPTRVIIRGIGTINSSSNPLYVVDGVVMEDFQFLNPNDIDRIEVLKDASSAAIYGARGANGVIIVSTKRGKRNQNFIRTIERKLLCRFASSFVAYGNMAKKYHRRFTPRRRIILL